ncbi:hypothetical protein SELMODRAFT_420099 [Selaginella moellendorffii]|uniref:Uncharacterized protein n=1 Tax=Selaginella moellendorffii TaxID=88036 RepID=D8SAZ2_SELML|nr:hypothetical protein SELMODRAFT_420099 [Selaginella moellendorffii]
MKQVTRDERNNYSATSDAGSSRENVYNLPPAREDHAASDIDPHREDEIKELEEGFDALDKSVELLWELVVDSEGGELREIVLSHHLPDLWAGIFQISHDGDDEAATSGQIHTLVEALPVAHAVEALMILLAKENSPPPWLEAHAGSALISVTPVCAARMSSTKSMLKLKRPKSGNV